MTSPKIDYVPRMEGLDALRGFALMGLFLVHMPELYELYWAHPVTDPTQLMWHDVIFTVFAGKSFALLALCFGVSFFIIMDRAAKRGVDFTGVSCGAWRCSAESGSCTACGIAAMCSKSWR